MVLLVNFSLYWNSPENAEKICMGNLVWNTTRLIELLLICVIIVKEMNIRRNMLIIYWYTSFLWNRKVLFQHWNGQKLTALLCRKFLWMWWCVYRNVKCWNGYVVILIIFRFFLYIWYIYQYLVITVRSVWCDFGLKSRLEISS